VWDTVVKYRVSHCSTKQATSISNKGWNIMASHAADKGHYCTSAKAITPLYDGMCDWCGEHPEPEYVWDGNNYHWVEN
jgi:hypothetical protein